MPTESNLLEIILYIAGAIITLSSALTIVVKYLKKQISGVAKEVTEETSKTLLTDIKKISDNLEDFKGCYEKERCNSAKVLMNLAQDRINQAHQHFMALDKIDPHSMYIIEQLYESYKSLGGNGHVDWQLQNLRNLAAKSAKENC